MMILYCSAIFLFQLASSSIVPRNVYVALHAANVHYRTVLISLETVSNCKQHTMVQGMVLSVYVFENICSEKR